MHRSLHVGVARPSAPVAARTAVVGGAVAVVVAYECSRGAPARAESLSTLDGLKAMVFGAPDAAAAAPTSKAPAAPAEPAAFDDEFQQHGEQRNKVVVALDAETVEALPVMSLDEVRACDGRARTAGASGDGDEEQQLLVTHDGIVYDVTQFANDHPGGRELLLTAAGQDLKHFFENYLVHARTDKAATWLAPLAVGRLSAEDAARASALTTPAVHVERRLALLWRARRRLLGVVVQLPGWMAVRQLVRFVGQLSRPFGRWLAGLLPVSVPGLSPGAEPLAKGGKVAVIGGGIAGCGAAWALARDGYEVTLYEARAHVSGNARTFDWDGFSDGRTVRSCVSVTACRRASTAPTRA